MECKINADSSFGLEKGITIHNLTLRLVKEAILIVFNSNFTQCLTKFYAVTVSFFKKSLLRPEFWIGNSKIQIFSNSQMQTRSKINFL